MSTAGGGAIPEQADDVIIVGGGLAGLFCALTMAPRPVTVLATAPIGKGASSAWAQGGIAAAISEGDSVEKHLIDTIEAGAGIVDEKIARSMVADAADRVQRTCSNMACPSIVAWKASSRSLAKPPTVSAGLSMSEAIWLVRQSWRALVETAP